MIVTTQPHADTVSRETRLWCNPFISCVEISFFFQAEDGIRDLTVTGVQTCALPICIRKSVGARERDIRAQFLLEAVSLSATGGLLGVLAGAGICWTMKAFTGMAAIP